MGVTNLVEHSRKQSRGKQPISRHPLFPAIVGLWGAVLSGSAGLAVTPSAAPAVVLAVLGGALGLIAARQIARPKAAPSEAAGAAAPSDGTGGPAGEGGDLWSELRTSRLALSAAPAEEPAPLDREPQILDLAAVEIGALDAVVESEPEPQPQPEPQPEPKPAVEADEAIVEPQAFAEPTAAERIAGMDLDGLSHVELLERLALSLHARGRRAAPVAVSITTPEATATEPAEAVPEPDPALVFPGRAERRAGTEPVETEQALRTALAALQRMSGAA